MAAISGRAEQAVRTGFNLAERGALYSARSQFIEALRILAEAVDAQHGTLAHTRALNAGLRAMQEVNDFIPRNGAFDNDLNLRLLVGSHRTPVLKDAALDNLTALQAQRMYLAYAQEQLAAAGADQPVASLALHGMGKICTVPPEMHGPPEQIAEAKAVVYHQAALMVEPKNFMAANELGVLLAHFGRFSESRSVLEHAVTMSGGPIEWQNLASVCDRLNQPTRAAEARQQATLAQSKLQSDGYATAGMKYPIQWLDPDSFATTNSMIADAAPVSSSSSTSLTSVMNKPAAKDATPPDGSAADIAAKPQSKSGFWSWLK
jgi:tetratricopeptide (TPR) repeat protein